MLIAKVTFCHPNALRITKYNNLKILDPAKTRLTWIAGGFNIFLSRERDLLSTPAPSHCILYSDQRGMEAEFYLINQRINHPIHLEEGLNLMQLRLSPGSDKSHKGP